MANQNNDGLNRSLRANTVKITLISTNKIQTEDSAKEAVEIGYSGRYLFTR